jgi:putative oxidoreductase
VPANPATSDSTAPHTGFVVFKILDKIPQSVISLAARIFPAAVFWMSGQTKVEGWHVGETFARCLEGGCNLWDELVAQVASVRLSDSVVDLFRDEYALPLVDPEIAARLAAFSEHFFPILLVIGLASRFAALALLGMTAVIEYVYPSSWPLHGTWATCFLVVIARGPGVVSLDWLLGRLLRR